MDEQNTKTLKMIFAGIGAGLIGCIIYLFFYNVLGLIAFVGAFAIIFLCGLAYKKVKNKPLVKKDYVIICIISFVEMLLISVVAFAIDLNIILDCGFFNCIKYIFDGSINPIIEYVTEGEITDYYFYMIKDLLFNVLFLVLGFVSYIKSDKQNSKQSISVSSNQSEQAEQSQPEIQEFDNNASNATREYVSCSHCGTSYDKSEGKCPNCGAKN